MVTVLTEVEKKALDEIFEAVKEDKVSAYVAMLFLNSKQQAYFTIKMAIAESKETHDEAKPVIPKRTVVQEPLRTCQWCVSRQCETCAERKPKACP